MTNEDLFNAIVSSKADTDRRHDELLNVFVSNKADTDGKHEEVPGAIFSLKERLGWKIARAGRFARKRDDVARLERHRRARTFQRMNASSVEARVLLNECKFVLDHGPGR